MLIVLFCLLKLLFVSPAWAEEVYFDYSFKNPILNSEGVSEAVFGYELVDISEADFVVRAMSTAGVVSIWDETMGHWVEGTKSWADMPVLCEEMKIKLPVLEGATEVWFEVQNVQRGVVYKTPQHSIGGHSVSDNYFKALNENISFWDFATEEKPLAREEVARSVEVSFSEVSQASLVYCLVLFSGAFLVGFFTKRSAKITQWQLSNAGGHPY